MGHQGITDSTSAEWAYSSTAEADSTAKLIIRGAGTVTVASALLGLLLPPKTPPTGQEFLWISVGAAALVALGGALIVLGPRWLRTTAHVSADEVLLSASGVRTRLDLDEIVSVTDSYFPSGGYGYRYLGKGHRGFISGGPQVDIKVRDSREFTVSVRSVPEFCAAVTAAKERP